MPTSRYKVLIVEKDGTELEYQEELALDADRVYFDNSTNGFTADGVQAAIEEAQNSAIGSIKSFSFMTSGNTSNKWLGFASNTAPSDQVPFIVPQDSEIKGVTFANRDNDVDIDIEIYVNGTLQHTENIRNKRWYYNVGISGPTCNQGDRISVYLKQYTGGTGDTTAQDPIVVVLVKFTDEEVATGGAQTGV